MPPGSLASNLDSQWHLTWSKPAYRSKSWLGVVLVAIRENFSHLTETKTEITETRRILCMLAGAYVFELCCSVVVI
jgi:spore coat polysaccharide biosynthesis predicted glycosyltransferase SpsG